MTTITTTLTLQSPVKELLTNKNDIQMLVKFLDTKGFKSDPVNVPVYERLVALLASCDTTATNRN